MSEKMWIWRDIIRSSAFIELSGKSAQVLLIFYSKVQIAKMKVKGRNQWITTNDKALEFCYAEAERIGITARQFTRAIDQNVEVGFLDIVESGMGIYKRKTIYALSDRWQRFGAHDFVPAARPKDTRAYRRTQAQRLRSQKKSVGKADCVPSIIIPALPDRAGKKALGAGRKGKGMRASR